MTGGATAAAALGLLPPVTPPWPHCGCGKERARSAGCAAAPASAPSGATASAAGLQLPWVLWVPGRAGFLLGCSWPPSALRFWGPAAVPWSSATLLSSRAFSGRRAGTGSAGTSVASGARWPAGWPAGCAAGSAAGCAAGSAVGSAAGSAAGCADPEAASACRGRRRSVKRASAAAGPVRQSSASCPLRLRMLHKRGQ